MKNNQDNQYVDRESIPVPHLQEILDTEYHHEHKITVRKDGVLIWEPNPLVEYLVNNDLVDLNKVVSHFRHKGGKNSEAYRKLYRDMGYTLDGYYTLFYINGEKEKYVPNKIA